MAVVFLQQFPTALAQKVAEILSLDDTAGVQCAIACVVERFNLPYAVSYQVKVRRIATDNPGGTPAFAKKVLFHFRNQEVAGITTFIDAFLGQVQLSGISTFEVETHRYTFVHPARQHRFTDERNVFVGGKNGVDFVEVDSCSY